ncbi:DUF5641 domain-containing protein [Nephila pilipes]|uniref:DUF5641 domain-containing protein n=1 Tax=Nephila pilipes TaxID=299642 RepID=A0A8X6MQK9_NEPPI|nr:DUF5641 domain-containing protein [Nephila pilipes]
MEELNSRSLNKRIKYRSKLLKDLRQRFRKEYLGELGQKHNEKQSRNPQIGEIVLIGNDSKKRLFWPLAKIIELIPVRDGKIRTVKLKTQHGTVLRPIQRIYPLEIYSKESVDVELGGEEPNSNNVTDNENNVTSADAVINRSQVTNKLPLYQSRISTLVKVFERILLSSLEQHAHNDDIIPPKQHCFRNTNLSLAPESKQQNYFWIQQ